MTPERWRQIEQLFHDARKRPAGERAAFLQGACGQDQALYREVQSLLDESASDDGFLAQPPVRAPLDANVAAPVMIGRSLGGYRLDHLLGAGGMGEVYRAHDARLGRDVAIKILPHAFTRNPERLARFEREARMLAALNHPNICAIYGLEEEDGIRFLILEFVDGQTLADKLTTSSALPASEALSFARQIADALEAAHERGIVHRDLKPANISITADRVVKVLDFGLAKTVGDSSSPDLSTVAAEGGSREGALIGTAAYMSPEQARGMAVDKRTDIWAFGCVVYEMLSGRTPFGGATLSDSIAKILEREPDWSALPPATSPTIRRLLQRCLTKEAKQRLRDIGDARLEIDAASALRSSEDVRATAPRRHTGATLLPWLVLAALVAFIASREVWRPTASEDPLAGAQFTALTDWAGTEALAEISPDGRFVTFLADRDGQLDLWWTQAGTGDFRNLTPDIPSLDTPGFLRTFGFSGDGANIWFGVIGRPNMLMPQTGGGARPFLTSDAKNLAWSPDGSRIVYFALNGERDPLWIADRTGADARPIAITPADKGDWAGIADSRAHNHNPVWSPDGKWIYFVHGVVRDWNHSSDEMDIWRIPPGGGVPERLTQLEAAVTVLAPLDPRTLLYIAPAEDGSGSWLWSFDIEERRSRRVVSGLEQFTSVSVSRDGRRVVATRANPTASLWSVPLKEDASGSDAQPYPVGTARALSPRFGGSALFYLSARGSGDGLWSFINGRTVEVQKGSDGMLLQPPASAPDGRRVAVIRKRERRHLLTMMSANGTESHTLASSLDTYGSADWSPDGHWIVTGGIDAAGRPGLFKIAADGDQDTQPIRLADGEAINPVWSPTDDLIVYAGPFARGQAPLFAVRPDGAAVNLASLRVSPGGYRFTRDGRGLLFLPRPESFDFWQFDFATGQSRQLTHLGARGTIRRFDVTPDGKHIVFDRAQPNSDIVLIERAAARQP